MNSYIIWFITNINSRSIHTMFIIVMAYSLVYFIQSNHIGIEHRSSQVLGPTKAKEPEMQVWCLY